MENYKLNFNKVKTVSLTIFISFFTKGIKAQESNIFYSEPETITSFLGTKHKIIEIEIIKYRGSENNKVRLPGKSDYRILKYIGDTLFLAINKSKDNEMDTTFYRFDRCGNLLSKKGQNIYNKYQNRYKNCKLMGKISNESEITSNGYLHQANIIRYTYDKAGLMQKEIMYDYLDSNIAKFANEYKYIGGLKDSMKEYYFDEDGNKLLNRFTKYVYGPKLDSINTYSSEFFLIDKKAYKYFSDGKIQSITINIDETSSYTYNSKGELESIIEGKGNKEFIIRYLD